MINRILAIVILTACISPGFGQTLKKVTHKFDDKSKEIYTVLKSDRSVKHGNYTIVTKDKTTVVQGKYDNNRKVGHWTYRGKHNAFPNTRGSIEYFEDGNLKWTKDWDPSKLRKVYYSEDNNIDSSVYSNGYLTVTEWYDKDSIRYHKRSEDGRISIQGTLYGSAPNGIWNYKFSGTNTRVSFNNGHRQGFQTAYFENGSVRSHYFINESGNLDGNFVMMFENGDTFLNINFQNGEYHGISRMWHSNGRLCTIAKYDTGRISYKIVYDENGQIVDELKDGNGDIFLYEINFKGDKTIFNAKKPYAKVPVRDGFYEGEYKYLDMDMDTPYIYTPYIYKRGVLYWKDSIYKRTEVTFYRLEERNLFDNSYQFCYEPECEFNSLFKMIGKELRYPFVAMITETQGKVLVEFTILQTGELGNIHVVSKKLGYGLEDEALRVIHLSSPFWLPLTTEGMPINTKFRIPIRFSL